MPRISAFYGITIEMYYGDHPPPHFHARYGGEAAKVAIRSGLIVAGHLPVPVLRLVRKWVDDHRTELEENWERVANDEKPKPVEPLK
ncbi:MAG TPA: DUF4160 domain-containing protein [Solirubrobacterales bacterium]|nr:DUF4160 domain-containing protein [Solirubrobacterales bacterium]